MREKKFDSFGFQVIKSKNHKGTNTQYKIKKSQVIQTEESYKSLHIDEQKEERLYNFLNEIYLRFEEALKDNETIRVYKDDLVVEDNYGGKQEQGTELSIIKELKSFEYENCS